MPSAFAVIVSHPVRLTASHPQPEAAVTLIVPLPPAAAIVAKLGAIVQLQSPPRPSCITVKCCPATVICPLRALLSKFSLTAKLSGALPLPLAADVTMIQLSLL